MPESTHFMGIPDTSKNVRLIFVKISDAGYPDKNQLRYCYRNRIITII